MLLAMAIRHALVVTANRPPGSGAEPAGHHRAVAELSRYRRCRSSWRRALLLGGMLGNELLAFASKAMQRWRGGPLLTTVVASVVFGGNWREIDGALVEG
jgi:hypothetical protein